MQEDQPDSRICQKPPEFLLSNKKNSREQSDREGEEWREEKGKKNREKNEEGVKQWRRPWNLYIFIYLAQITKGLHQQDIPWGAGAAAEGVVGIHNALEWRPE